MLLKAVGYDVKDGFVYKDGKQHFDKYTQDPVSVNNLAVLPTQDGYVVLDNNVFSIILYMEEGQRPMSQPLKFGFCYNCDEHRILNEDNLCKECAEKRWIKCGKCGCKSHNPTDIKERYCGPCHTFLKEDEYELGVG